MTKTEESVLAYLSSNPGVTQAEIQRACKIPASRISRTMQRLRKMGRVTPRYARILLTKSKVRRRDPDEQRIIRLLRRQGPMSVREVARVLYDPEALANEHRQYKEVETAITALTRVGIVSRARSVWPL